MAAQRAGDARSARRPSSTTDRANSDGGTTLRGSGGIGIAAVAEQIP
jgi:hypothetical protein